MSEQKTVASKLIYEGRALSLRVYDVEMPLGRRTTREIVEHRDGVAIVALDDDGSVLLVSQFRKPAERVLLEIPAGGVEPGERAEESAQRELREETGYRAEKMECLGGFYSTPGFCTEYLHLFLAEKLHLSPLPAADDEAIELVRAHLGEIEGLIISGEICDAKSIAGLVRVILELRRKHEDMPLM